jgi:hypothetical protein
MDRNVAFESAQREAFRGLKKARDAEPGSSVPSVRSRANTKAKGKVVRTLFNHYQDSFSLRQAAMITFKVSSIIFLPYGTVKVG